jgi:hypothetical protein
VQPSSSTTSLVVWKTAQQENCILERTCHLFPSYYLLFLPPTVHSTNLLQCSPSLHHPSFDATLVFHNTQTNKVAYPCIPCSKFRINICRKHAKSWLPLTKIKQKNETLKPVVFTTIRVFFCPVTLPPSVNPLNLVYRCAHSGYIIWSMHWYWRTLLGCHDFRQYLPFGSTCLIRSRDQC